MAAAAFSTLMKWKRKKPKSRKARRRDPEVLDALIEQYQHRPPRYLTHMTHNQATAEDLFQETWIRVLEKGHQYDGKSRFATWLMTIADNVAIDHLRKKAPQSLDQTRDTEDAVPFEPVSSGLCPLSMLRPARTERASRRRWKRLRRFFARCWCCDSRSS